MLNCVMIWTKQIHIDIGDIKIIFIKHNLKFDFIYKQVNVSHI